MAQKARSPRVREPVQVYLDPGDRALLEEAARRTGLARAEILRRGLRTIAQHLLAERAPGSGFEYLIGILGDDPSIPPDLAARHDEYLYEALGGDAGER
ncbi:MAG: CopG family transcriptional regulator [Gemmatimonadales bacterium]